MPRRFVKTLDGAQRVPIHWDTSNNFEVTKQALEASYEKAQNDNINVKGLLITNPSNPLVPNHWYFQWGEKSVNHRNKACSQYHFHRWLQSSTAVADSHQLIISFCGVVKMANLGIFLLLNRRYECKTNGWENVCKRLRKRLREDEFENQRMKSLYSLF